MNKINRLGLIGMYVCPLFLWACHSNNGAVKLEDSLQGQQTNILPKSSIANTINDSVFILVDKNSFVPYNGKHASQIPEFDSTGKEGKLDLGNAELILKNTGRYEHVLGDYDVYDFSFFFKKQLLFSRKKIFGANSPYISSDSSWFTIQFCTNPGESYSKWSISLVEVQSKKEYLVDSQVYVPTSAPIAYKGASPFVIYITGNLLRCYDIKSTVMHDVAYLKYIDLDQEDVCIDKIYDVKIESGQLSGKIILLFGGKESEPIYRKGGFSVPVNF
jgi:hypothetical protein